MPFANLYLHIIVEKTKKKKKNPKVHMKIASKVLTIIYTQWLVF